MQSNGFLYVASVNKAYYYAAKRSAESLLDFYPEANITLFTHEEWVEPEDSELFENVITEGVPNHIRAKLWALSKSPYDKTLYVDCDTLIEHEDIVDVFNLIDTDTDVLFTRNRPYNAKITKLSETEEMIYHCGLVLYRNNSQTNRLMDAWYHNYRIQCKPDWDSTPYPYDVRRWDTFTMWNLLANTDHGVKVGEFPEPDARWNFVIGYRDDELQGQERVIIHYTIPESEKYRYEIYSAK
tara:strand:- start:5807 stop:6526 length:720 start_codon:yes stop_codon:yes gene_type:complete